MRKIPWDCPGVELMFSGKAWPRRICNLERAFPGNACAQRLRILA